MGEGERGMKTVTIVLTIPDGVAVQVTEQTAGAVVPPPAAAAASAPSCQHGLRIHKAGTNKNGKAYSGWFCSEDDCSPVWG